MNFSKKNHELVGQNEQIVKKSQKHDANLQKNSTLYFQVGLILTLLATYGLFEMQFSITEISITSDNFVPEDPDVYVNYVPETHKEPITVKKEVPRKKLLALNFEQIENDEILESLEKDIITEPIDESTEGVKIEDVFPDDIVPDLPIDFIAVEQIPIYPGCEKFTKREDLKNCMSQKISKLVGKKFNADIAADLGLTGKQNIYVQFTIDKTGKVSKIKARAPHLKLKNEAVKVVNKIPQMIPGKQRDQNVEVIYTLPISLQVNY